MLDRAISASPSTPSLTDAVADAVTAAGDRHAPVTYTAVLPLARSTMQAIAAHLLAHRLRIGTRIGRRALGCFAQAVLYCRWLVEATRLTQLAVDAGISLKTAYRYLHETLDVLAEQAPDLRSALSAARQAGQTHLAIDGTEPLSVAA